MTERGSNNVSLGWLLIVVGAILTVSNFSSFGWLGSWTWGSLLVLVGCAFLYQFWRDRQQWWALIPGFALLAAGLTTLFGGHGGRLLLAALGLGFIGVYLADARRWWAIIPGGVLLSLAAAGWLGSSTGLVLFVGLTLTFGYVYLRPGGREEQPWALFPALVSLAMVIILLGRVVLAGTLLPLVLIGAGVYLVWRTKGRPEGGNDGA